MNAYKIMSWTAQQREYSRERFEPLFEKYVKLRDIYNRNLDLQILSFEQESKLMYTINKLEDTLKRLQELPKLKWRL